MLGEELERTLQNALNIALKYKHQFITLEHLLLHFLPTRMLLKFLRPAI